jgi:hypothetical protein
MFVTHEATLSIGETKFTIGRSKPNHVNLTVGRLSHTIPVAELVTAAMRIFKLIGHSPSLDELDYMRDVVREFIQ